MNLNINKRYEVLEHKADLKVRVFGRTKEELFSNALFALTEGLKPDVRPGEQIIRQVKIKSPDLSTLLVDFLSEVLYLIQANKEIYVNVKFSEFSDTELVAKLFGQKIERFGEDIKAVTYHGLEVKKVNSAWEATVLFDI